LTHTIQIDVNVAIARAIKLKMRRVVSWGNGFIYNGVAVCDLRLYATFEKDLISSIPLFLLPRENILYFSTFALRLRFLPF
jgi:hypothetical protein